jgi:hypothetical protein
MLSGNFSVLGLCHIVGLHKGRSLTNRLNNFLFLECALKTLMAVHLVHILVVTSSLSLVGSRMPGTECLS